MIGTRSEIMGIVMGMLAASSFLGGPSVGLALLAAVAACKPASESERPATPPPPATVAQTTADRAAAPRATAQPAALRPEPVVAGDPKPGPSMPEPPPIVPSTDILKRDVVTERAVVKHILIGWKDLAPNYRGKMDERATKRTRKQALELARKLLVQVRSGGTMDALMKAHSEDPGSASTGRTYEVTPGARLVPPFKKLSLRLKKGEAGVIESRYGFHVIQRVE